MIRIWYHKNCNDGLAAAAVVLDALASDQGRQLAGVITRNPFVRCEPVNYGEPMPEVEAGDNVFIVDFCFPRLLLMELVNRINAVSPEMNQIYPEGTPRGSLVLLDHHKTAQADLMEPFCPVGSNVIVEFDMSESGASLAWKFFHADKIDCTECGGSGLEYPAIVDPSDQLYGLVCERCRGLKKEWAWHISPSGEMRTPFFIELVKERDLWQFGRGEIVNQMHAGLLMELPRTPEGWVRFLRMGEQELRLVAKNGETILSYQKTLIERAMKSFWTETVTFQNADGEVVSYEVPCCMAQECVSEIGEALLYAKSQAPFSMTYRDYAHLDQLGSTQLIRKYSLRSGRKGTASENFDCSVVAKALGGGGHKFACGFERRLDSALLPEQR